MKKEQDRLKKCGKTGVMVSGLLICVMLTPCMALASDYREELQWSRPGDGTFRGEQRGVASG